MAYLFNDRQNEVRCFNRDHKPRVMIADGAVGSGKTRIMLCCWVADQWQNRDKKRDYIMTGYTMGSLERNILVPLHDDFGIDATPGQDGVFELWGNRINCFGTDKAHSWKAIRGIQTAYGHYGNEVTLSHRSAVDECRNRCRGQNSRFFYETNPEGPNHYIYKTLIEPAIRDGNNSKLARFNFTLFDNDKEHNGFLPDEYIEQQLSIYSGVAYRKLVNGEWCAIEGQIYFPDQLQYYPDSEKENPAWWTGATIHGYMDPATGSRKKTGCFTAAFAAARKGEKIYLTDAIVRKIPPNLVNGEVTKLIQKYHYQKFAIEDNFSQDAYVVQPLRQMNPYANIVGQSSREDKLSRLVGMMDTVYNKLVFPESWLTDKNSDGWLLLQQLANVTADRPEGAETDDQFLDGPDALEGLIRTFKTTGAVQQSASLGGKKRQIEW